MKNKIIAIIVVIALMAGAVTATALIQGKKTDSIKSELEKSRSDAETLQTQLQLAEEELQTKSQLAEEALNDGKEILTDLINRIDYKGETVFVIGHKTPDSDTVASAIGMAHLLNALGIPAEARVAGGLNLESEFALSELKYTAPEILEDATGKQLWLVDHSTSSQMVNGAEDARIVGITDHHGIGDAETSETICVLSCPAGSTCAIVFKLCAICDAELPKDVASVLLAGLLSDTANMKSSAVTKLDEAAFERLKELSEITDTDALFDGMLEAKLSYKGLSDREIFYSDYKNYEHNGISYGIGCVKVARPDLIPAMAERMQATIKAEMENGCESDLILYHIYDVDYSTGYTGYCGKDAELAKTIMEGTFGDIAENNDEYLVFKPSLSRKKDIVPPIDAFLDTLK